MPHSFVCFDFLCSLAVHSYTGVDGGFQGVIEFAGDACYAGVVVVLVQGIVACVVGCLLHCEALMPHFAASCPIAIGLALLVVRFISYLVEQVLVSDFSPVSAPHAAMSYGDMAAAPLWGAPFMLWRTALCWMVARRSFNCQASAWGILRSVVHLAMAGAAGCGTGFGYDLEGSSDPELPMMSSDYTHTSAPSAAALASRASVVAAPMLIRGLLPCLRFLSFAAPCDRVGGAHRAACCRDGCRARARARVRGRGRAVGAGCG